MARYTYVLCLSLSNTWSALAVRTCRASCQWSTRPRRRVLRRPQSRALQRHLSLWFRLSRRVPSCGPFVPSWVRGSQSAICMLASACHVAHVLLRASAVPSGPHIWTTPGYLTSTWPAITVSWRLCMQVRRLWKRASFVEPSIRCALAFFVRRGVRGPQSLLQRASFLVGAT